ASASPQASARTTRRGIGIHTHPRTPRDLYGFPAIATVAGGAASTWRPVCICLGWRTGLPRVAYRASRRRRRANDAASSSAAAADAPAPPPPDAPTAQPQPPPPPANP